MYRYHEIPIEVPKGAGFFDLKKNQPYKVQLPEDMVTSEGRDQVIKYLRAVLGKDRWNRVLPDDWDWSWVVTKDESGQNYVGTLPKRISRYCHKAWGFKLESTHLQEIGNIARRNTNKTDSYVFELVDKIDWDSGDFGDQGSCFWSDYEVTKDELLPDYNGDRPCAVRFYRAQPEYETHNIFAREHITWTCDKTGEVQHYIDSLLPGRMEKWTNCCRSCKMNSEYGLRLLRQYHRDVERGRRKAGEYASYNVVVKQTGTGFARSWLACTEGDESFVMFNGYPTSFQLYDQARVLATALGWTYRRINIDSYGTIYLNGDAIRVASPNYGGEIEKSFMLDLPEVERYYCEWCDDPIRGDDYYTTTTGYIICEYCYNHDASNCDDCGETFHNDDMYWIESAQRNVCEDCRDNGYTNCDHCGEDYNNDEMVCVEDTGEHYCRNCTDYLYEHSDGYFYAYEEESEDE